MKKTGYSEILDATKFTIRAGNSYRYFGSVHKVVAYMISMNPRFSYDHMITNDIAVMRVKNPFIFGKFIDPVVICSNRFYNELYLNNELLVIGWGNTVRNFNT